jgi:AcrR family transcriptional regulator
MARTVNPGIHAVRRDAFVDAAQRLIQAKGYEQMSVQDVLDALDASRGAFYHYFDSKTALLEAVIDQQVDGALASVQPLLADPDLTAIAKLAGVFSGIASWKNARRDLMLGLLETWLADDNAIVREKLRREVMRRMTPLIGEVVAQGAREGAFSASSPAHAAQVLVSLLLATNEVASRLFVARQTNTITFDEAKQTLNTYGEGFERILGARPGSIVLVDEVTLHLWFD